MSLHGNSGNRVKHLNGTSGCSHYRKVQASSLSSTKCATNGCSGMATRACHVIMSNQSSDSGNRYIIYACPSCNGSRNGQVYEIRSNALMHQLVGCDCGYL